MDSTGLRGRRALPGQLAPQAILEDEEIRARRQTPARVDRLDILEQADRLDTLEQADRLDTLEQADRLDILGQADRLDILEQVDRLDILGQAGRLDILEQVDRLAIPDPPDNLELIPMYSDPQEKLAQRAHMDLNTPYFPSQVASTNPPSSTTFQPTSFLGQLSKTSQLPRRSVDNGSRSLILIGMGALGIIACLIRNGA